MKTLIEALKALEASSIESQEYLTDGETGMLPEVQAVVEAADALLIKTGGHPDFKAIAELAEAGWQVRPGETDSFGWLSGVIPTSKGLVVYG